MDTAPDPADVQRLEQITTADDFPREWLTVEQYVAELDRRGFWQGITAQPADRPKWLRDIFTGMHMQDDKGGFAGWVWCEIGQTYKHHELVQTSDEWDRIAENMQRHLQKKLSIN